MREEENASDSTPSAALGAALDFSFSLPPLILNYDFLGELLRSGGFPQCPVCLVTDLCLQGQPASHPGWAVRVAHDAFPYEGFHPEITNFLVSCFLI